MSVRKMVIVPHQLLHEIKQWREEQSQKPMLPQNPQVTNVAHLHKDMNKTLERSDISETDKAQKYGETLIKLQNSFEKVKNPTFSQSISNNQELGLKNVSLHDRILESVPKTMQRKANLLLNILQENDNISWDNQGLVTYKGRTIPGSNIIDLINDSLRKRKGIEPRGWQTFSRALHESNVPQEVIGNLARWQWMQKHDPGSESSETSEISFSTPIRTPIGTAMRSSTKTPFKSSLKSVKKKTLSHLHKMSPYTSTREKEKRKDFYTQQLLSPIKKDSSPKSLQSWEPY